MILTFKDGQDVGLCARGQRAFCRQHGIDFRDFVRNGVPFERVEGIDDANLKLALEAARKREAG